MGRRRRRGDCVALAQMYFSAPICVSKQSFFFIFMIIFDLF
jgi:hypothetical protein